MKRSTRMEIAVLVAAISALWPRWSPAQQPGTPRAPRRTPAVEVYQRWKDSVVLLNGPIVKKGRPGTEEFFKGTGNPNREFNVGTGFVIHADGYILTNAHAMQRVIEHRVALSDGKTYQAELIASVWEEDLALLKIDAPKPLRAVVLAPAGDIMVGETVIAIGNPHRLLHTCTTGVVSAVGRNTKPDDMPGVTLGDLVQTDAGINPGSSGGPWFNVLGEVLAVTTSMKRESENIAFGISTATIHRRLPAMLDVHRRYGLISGLEVADAAPCSVAGVAADTPADQAGIKPGDVIRRIDDREIAGPTDFHLALVGRTPDQTLSLQLLRGDESIEVKLTLAVRPKLDAAALLADRLGLSVTALDDKTARDMQLHVARGLVITKVDADRYTDVDDPPAVGDVLARIGKIGPRDPDHAALLLDQLDPSVPVDFILLRKKDTVLSRIDVHLAPRKAAVENEGE